MALQLEGTLQVILKGFSFTSHIHVEHGYSLGIAFTL